MKLLINLATRGRPGLLAQTIVQTLSNVRHDETVLMVSLDDDDAETIELVASGRLGFVPGSERLLWSRAPREDSLGAKYNRALDVPADVYMTMVDHSPQCTPGFDLKILEAAVLFPDGIGVVYNHLANATFPGLNAVTAQLAARMGFIYPPYFPYWFVDHWLDDVARLIDRISFADVVVDCSRRPGTQELREPAFWATFYDAAYLVRRRCAQDIIGSGGFAEPEWRKQMLLRRYPLVEFRSRWVNDQVRASAHLMRDAGAPDERYARLKAQAVSMLAEFVAQIEAEEAESLAA